MKDIMLFQAPPLPIREEQGELPFGGEAAELLKGRLEDPNRIRDFALAGCAYLTIRSGMTHTRFTYRIRAPHHHTTLEREAWKLKPVWFVSVLTGPDNLNHYEWIGQILATKRFSYGSSRRVCRVSQDAPSVDAFAWFWQSVIERTDRLRHIEVWHEGRCGRCGRMLTVPDSIETGFGPDCAEIIKLEARR